MRYILTAFLFCVTLFNYAQVNDDFSDGDFTSNPVWIGNAVNFEVDGNQQLHLNAPAVTDTMYLSTVNNMIDNTEWSFLVHLDFNPSSSNLARIYLISDQTDLTASLNGYFVQIGGTEDEVSLYKQTGLIINEIIDGTDDIVDNDPVEVRVKVTRTAAGDWTLMADSTGNLNYISQGSVNDTDFSSSVSFGVFCKYTSTRSDKFYFDDFSVAPMILVDTIPPQITNIEVVSDQVVLLYFTENIDDFTGNNPINYVGDNGLGSPVTAEVLASNKQIVELTFSPSFQEGVDYTLSVQNVQDDSGNVMPNSTIHFMYNAPYFGTYKDVVITELMADPSPVVGLPETEYIEIYNNTNQTISLENWTISDGTTTITFGDYNIFPQTYMLCYEPATDVYFSIFNVIETALPSLNNAGDVIVLKDDAGTIIDSVAYTIGWYNSIQKSLGGWSLELKNPNAPCHDPNNWSASEHNDGGTPGYENSIYTATPITDPPQILDTYIENDSIIYVVFNKSISGGSVGVEPSTLFSKSVFGSELRIVLINFDTTLTYQITLSDYADCWGNSMDDYTFSFALPQIPEKNDIIINEILFNPETGGSDYVELVNVSNKVLSLADFQIGNIENGEITNQKLISESQKLWFPGDYLVVTEDSLGVINFFPNYALGKFHQIDLPSYNNDSGTVVLQFNSLVIDQFSYSEEMHFKLIDDLNGKALERLSFNEPSNLVDNWHTASEYEGWGTPGYLNSQTSNSVFDAEVQLSQPIFSPDNDGYQDVLEISYQFSSAENVLDVVVYNAIGQTIRELKDNFYPGQKGVIVWDGIDNNGRKANVGTYIIGVTVFDLQGNVKQYKLVGVLATKL